MNDKIAEAITKLAAKFGTTVEHLWAVLVRQAAIDAATDIVIAVAIVFATVVWGRLTFIKGKSGEWDEVGICLAWIASFSLGAFAICAVCSAFQSTAIAIFNPEYFALHAMTGK